MDVQRASALLRRRESELRGRQPPPIGGDSKLIEWLELTRATLERVFGAESRHLELFSNLEWKAPDFAECAIDASYFVEAQSRADGLLKAWIKEVQELVDPPAVLEGTAYDPELWRFVEHSVNAEQWAQVASTAVTFVEDRLRSWAGLTEEQYGKDIIVAVLKPEGGAFPLGRTAGEKQGWLSLGIGFVQGAGNADRHRIQRRPDLKPYAVGVLGTASLLLTQLRYEHGNRFVDETAVSKGESSGTEAL